MIKKIFVTLPALFFTLSSPASTLPTNKYYGGFEMGVANEILQYKNSYNLTGTAYPKSVSYNTLFNYDANSFAVTGGLVAGYAKEINDRFGIDYEFLLMANSGNVSATDQMQSPFTYTPAALQEYTARTQLSLSYGFDLAVKPTAVITPELTGYLKAGFANAELHSSLNITHNNALTNEVYNATNGNMNRNVWGYVIGAGFELAISDKCSLFGEYNFHQYESTRLKTVTITDNGTGALPGENVTNTIIYKRKVLPYINSFNVGLHYYFGGKNNA